MVAKLLQMTLETYGYDSWMDRKDLSVTSPVLKKTVEIQICGKKIAILCMGVGDLERCSAEDDFFRWEIDQVRQLENEGTLRVVVIVHGTTEVEDLICGPSLVDSHRRRVLKKVGEWGDNLLQYLRTHYVIFFDIDALDSMVEKIISRLNEKQ